MTYKGIDLDFTNLELKKPKLTVKYAFKFLMLPASLLHLAFCSVFFLGEAYLLSYYNFISFIVYFIIFVWNNKENLFISFCVVFLEILIHAFLCDYYLGPDYGFYLYTACIIPMLYFISFELSGKMRFTYISSVLVWISIIFLKIDKPMIRTIEENFTNFKVTFYNINLSFAWIFINVLILAYVFEMRFAKQILEKKNEILNYSANIDHLTNLPNRHFTQKQLKNSINEFNKTKRPFSILIGDIDNFKSFNDNYGHDIGDKVLITVSDILRKYSTENPNIFVSRWGGEEFLIIIKNSSIDNSKKIGENILNSIRMCSIPYNDTNLSVTMTLGGAIYEKVGYNFEDVIKYADNNLYVGKSTTKDCIII